MREDIERTADEMLRVQLGRGFSDCTDLRVRGQIMRLGYPVHPSASTTSSFTMRQENGRPPASTFAVASSTRGSLIIHDDLF
jgi:hypothetical protein